MKIKRDGLKIILKKSFLTLELQKKNMKNLKKEMMILCRN